MNKTLHDLLHRQLRRAGIAPDAIDLSAPSWARLLDGVSRAYSDADRDRYLMKRALEVSSREMRELYDRLEETQQIAGLGSWSFDRQGRCLEWSDECARIFGQMAGDVRPNYLALYKRFAERDRAQLNDAMRAALDHGTPFTLELRLYLPNGSTRWVRLMGRRANATRGDETPVKSNENLRVHGAIMDITPHKLVQLRHAIEHTITLLLADSTSALTASVMQQIIQNIVETLGWQCGAFWELDERERVFKRRTQWTDGHRRAAQFYALVPNNLPAEASCRGLIPKTIANSGPIWVTDILADADFGPFQEAARSASMRTAFSLPIEVEGKVIGTLEFFSRRIQQADPNILQNGRFIGRQISQFFQRRRAEAALRESEQHFRSLVEQAADGFYVFDAAGQLVDVNQCACDSLGYTRTELLSLHVSAIDAGSSEEDRRMLYARILEGTPIALESQYRRKDGQTFPVEIRISSIAISGQQHFLALVRDVTDRRRLQDHIHHLAYHDALTGLPNRAMFSRTLNHVLARARRQNKQLALLFIDLDRFKNINDTLGHDNGDRLLQEITRRLLSSLREIDMVARFGGDEFVVLLEDMVDVNHATTVANKILAAIDQEYQLNYQPVHVTTSIGISLFPHDGADESTLMKHADIAMYQAKAEGKNGYRFYSAQMNAHSFEHLAIETRLRRAVERGEFVLHYQPKVNLQTGAISGVEALLRWSHPELGTVMPDKFIPLAEETGLVISIGYWVLREICRNFMEWRLQGLPIVPIAINLSPRQFADANLLHEISATLRESGMPPEFLELEITESTVMHNPEKALQILSSLRALGIRVAVDDFGIGHSSLSQLKRLPIDIIKIDRSFVQGIASDNADAAITEAIISMSKRLQISVIAEGVETQEQHDLLRRLGCDEYQGFLFSQPLSVTDLTPVLRDNMARQKKEPAPVNRLAVVRR
ncbi:MAG: EAL domain-containing protein [Burkholderiaceae bacterium]|nr:MAG: EAL domain-containing protein [Burkholderiaceae bacterium]